MCPVRTGSVPRTLAYDAVGNMVSNTTSVQGALNLQLKWDAEYRPVLIYNPTTKASTQLSYDGLGRRVKMIESTGTNTVVKQFVWDGLSLAEERNSSDTVTEQFYSWGQMQKSNPLYFTRDHLGSIRDVTNTAGTLEAHYDYDPYGRRTVTSGTDLIEFGFTGHYYHAPSALTFAPYRAYAADLGRWLSRDPIGIKAGSNVYSYVMSNPASSIDVYGEFNWPAVARGVQRVWNDPSSANPFTSSEANQAWQQGFEAGLGVSLGAMLPYATPEAGLITQTAFVGLGSGAIAIDVNAWQPGVGNTCNIASIGIQGTLTGATFNLLGAGAQSYFDSMLPGAQANWWQGLSTDQQLMVQSGLMPIPSAAQLGVQSISSAAASTVNFFSNFGPP